MRLPMIILPMLLLAVPVAEAKRGAGAPPPRLQAQDCEEMARYAEYAATMRDSGLSSAEVLDFMRGKLRQEARATGAPAREVAEADEGLTEMVLTVYASPKTPAAIKLLPKTPAAIKLLPKTPAAIKLLEFQACMRLR